MQTLVVYLNAASIFCLVGAVVFNVLAIRAVNRSIDALDRRMKLLEEHVFPFVKR